jgi:hypothetical protein
VTDLIYSIFKLPWVSGTQNHQKLRSILLYFPEGGGMHSLPSLEFFELSSLGSDYFCFFSVDKGNIQTLSADV